MDQVVFHGPEIGLISIAEDECLSELTLSGWVTMSYFQCKSEGDLKTWSEKKSITFHVPEGTHIPSPSVEDDSNGEYNGADRWYNAVQRYVSGRLHGGMNMTLYSDISACAVRICDSEIYGYVLGCRVPWTPASLRCEIPFYWGGHRVNADEKLKEVKTVVQNTTTLLADIVKLVVDEWLFAKPNLAEWLARLQPRPSSSELLECFYEDDTSHILKSIHFLLPW
jgi:hypothetical protein